jgi:hypothetical protein
MPGLDLDVKPGADVASPSKSHATSVQINIESIRLHVSSLAARIQSKISMETVCTSSTI